MFSWRECRRRWFLSLAEWGDLRVECGPRYLALLKISFLIQPGVLLLYEEANVVVRRRGEPQLQVEILVVVEGSFVPGTQTSKLTTNQIENCFEEDLFKRRF